MAPQGTLLKALLCERHWQKYATFCREYDKVARKVDPALAGSWPSRAQYSRWLAGGLKRLPQPDHCRILVAMFPGLTADQLFSPLSATAGVEVAEVDTERPSERRPVGRTQATTPAPTGDVPSEGEAGDTLSAGQPATLGEEINMAAEDAARFVRRARGAVDQDVLEQLHADVRRLAVDYLAKPPYAVFRPLSRLRAEVFGMLEEHQRPRFLPELYRIGGRLCALL